MGWEEFLDNNEKVVATFHHRKKKLTTVIGMTEKRSFVYQKKKTTRERFLSSKYPITTCEYMFRKLSIIHWIVICIFIVFMLLEAETQFSYFINALALISAKDYGSNDEQSRAIQNATEIYSRYIIFGFIFIGAAIVIFLIAFFFRHLAIIRTYIGNEPVVLRSRRAVENIVEFIKIIHAEHPIESEGIAGGIGSTLSVKGKHYIKIGIILIILYIIYTMLLGYLLPF